MEAAVAVLCVAVIPVACTVALTVRVHQTNFVVVSNIMTG